MARYSWWGPAIRWLQETFCDEGTSVEPQYDGTTLGEYGWSPCEVGLAGRDEVPAAAP